MRLIKTIKKPRLRMLGFAEVSIQELSCMRQPSLKVAPLGRHPDLENRFIIPTTFITKQLEVKCSVPSSASSIDEKDHRSLARSRAYR